MTLSGTGPVVEATVSVPQGDELMEVSATVDVSLGGGLERTDEAPLGSVRPEILGWVSPRGRWHPGAAVTIPAEECGTWTVQARYLPDAAVRVAVGSKVLDG